MTANQSSPAFRCNVVPENSHGSMKVGWSWQDVRVLDTSRDAFTVEVKHSVFRRLKEGCRTVLRFNDEIWQVECTAVFQLVSGKISLTMTRIKDLTQMHGPKSNIWSVLPLPNPTADPVLPLALLISFLFACVALPGMGDTLGTAPKIRKVVQDVWRKSTGY